MIEGLVDLHVHTTASDGTMSPGELVSYAKTRGVSVLGITDHDTISGLNEAEKAGRMLGVEIVPGIEISVDYSKDMHILGYYINDSVKLKERLSVINNNRKTRNLKIIAKLKNSGMDISWEEVEETAKGENVGRPHIAMVMAAKGYVKSIEQAFAQYLARGRAAYEERGKLSPGDGMNMIIEAGGIPVLAHPRYLQLEKTELEHLIVQLKEYGLAGIEAYYSMNSSEETETYLKLAQKFNLIPTGGTDFHGGNKPEIEIGVGKGNMRLGYDIVEILKKTKNYT